MLNRLLIGILLCVAPQTASAKSTIVWDFTGKNTPPGRWEVRGITQVNAAQDGLRINADKDGYMTAKTLFGRNIDAVVLTIRTRQDMEAILLWQEPGIAVKSFNQLPFIINGKDEEQVIDIDLSTLPIWSERTGEFGFGLPKGADVLLRRIEFVSWNQFEKSYHGILSVFKFDKFTPQSINFLWGPHVNFNPIARADMYLMDPPLGVSAMWIVYAALIISAAILMKDVIRLKKENPKAAAAFFTIFAAIWLLLDLRMGSEIISYALTDWKDYILAEEGNKNFRNHRSFPETVSEVLPELTSSGAYLFLGPGKPIYFSAMRYLSYPVLPAETGPEAAQAKMGFIFGNREVIVNERGELVTLKGTLHPGPCTAAKEFRDDSALIRCSTQTDLQTIPTK